MTHHLKRRFDMLLQKERHAARDAYIFQTLTLPTAVCDVKTDYTLPFKPVPFSEMDFWTIHYALIKTLLKDHATGANICWATMNYIELGEDFHSDKPLTEALITGDNQDVVQSRSKKLLHIQKERTQKKAEVFTPSWIVDKQVSVVLDEFKDMPLREFLETTWMEITCGEAPYMTNRYEMGTGQAIPLDERVGFIDRKFQRLNKEVAPESDRLWINHVKRIYQSSYGYEYQGDSLVLARKNLLLTFVENHIAHFGKYPSNHMLELIADIISWNVFQMDGLTCAVPCGILKENECVFELAVVKDWTTGEVNAMKNIGKSEGEENEI